MLKHALKMKQITFILFYFFSQSVLGQTTFIVDNFSKEYYGKLYIADTTEVFSKGWIAIFDKKNEKQLIKVDSDELTFTLHEGNVIANIKELPYGEQSQILYEDYNFDGVKDFAIMDGHNSCYHGPSFQIYLATANGFEQNQEFTTLAQEYCGMFDVDYETKTIHTMTKSGCCWHQYSEFKVKDNKPYPEKIVEEEISPLGVTWEYEEQNLIHGKMIKSTYQKLALELDADSLLLSFEFENKKRMQIFMYDNRLYYLFTDANDKIELLYNNSFTYSNSDNTLSFTSRNTEYKIYDDKIVAVTPQKTYSMKAIITTKRGTLIKLKNIKPENVTT